ncbi:peptide-methionine (S)-S-oxide reductase MsrA [Candidatus Micrarchaeota archaeon]|nr:peptide-methionine (S)-S-oxide reductase MsrA [Candidatus Micrarchaeota archaeon]
MSTFETAAFGAGCFWGVEEAFSELKGVIETSVGYMGGSVKNPSYKLVCSGETGHAEVVQVVFDPKIISYRELVDFFWTIHDPTQLNRQGPDYGEQYRSVIFYYSEEQKETALASLEKARSKFKEKIVTQIVPANGFNKAEEYHQKYLQKRGLKVC